MSFQANGLIERYKNDPHFRQLVKNMENLIVEHGFTPMELREAGFLAHYNYEMSRTLFTLHHHKLLSITNLHFNIHHTLL